MATYTAKKLNPRVEGNQFLVDIEIYRDGALILPWQLRFTQRPTEQEIAYLVKGRIDTLKDVQDGTGTITEGDVAIPADPAPAVVDTAFQDWTRDYLRFTRLAPMVQHGIILETNTKWVNVKTRLRNNLKPEYLDADFIV
jgi:hypothetical protein